MILYLKNPKDVEEVIVEVLDIIFVDFKIIFLVVIELTNLRYDICNLLFCIHFIMHEIHQKLINRINYLTTDYREFINEDIGFVVTKKKCTTQNSI